MKHTEEGSYVTYCWTKPRECKIHTCIAPYSKNANATHVIETANSLVVVDAQFFSYYAKKFREYIDKLNKPIKYLFITHAHPDHYFGLSAGFSDIPSFTTAGIKEEIMSTWKDVFDKLKCQYNDEIPDQIMYPANIIEDQKITVDCLDIHIHTVKCAEDKEQLVLKIPELNVVIMQDLTYNCVHLHLSPYIRNWMNILKRKAEYLPNDVIILAGHGKPGGKELIYMNIHYLNKACMSLNTPGIDADTFKCKMISAYPNWYGRKIIDSYLPKFFNMSHY